MVVARRVRIRTVRAASVFEAPRFVDRRKLRSARYEGSTQVDISVPCHGAPAPSSTPAVGEAVRPPVEVVGTTAFVSARFAGVRILDIGDFTSVIFTDNFETGDTTAWQ
jgi:hypothetical protein